MRVVSTWASSNDTHIVLGQWGGSEGEGADKEGPSLLKGREGKGGERRGKERELWSGTSRVCTSTA